jgi:hypothetical protein
MVRFALSASTVSTRPWALSLKFILRNGVQIVTITYTKHPTYAQGSGRSVAMALAPPVAPPPPPPPTGGGGSRSQCNYTLSVDLGHRSFAYKISDRYSTVRTTYNSELFPAQSILQSETGSNSPPLSTAGPQSARVLSCVISRLEVPTAFVGKFGT